jgi:hyperosmotically inducible periplasmic protein
MQSTLKKSVLAGGLAVFVAMMGAGCSSPSDRSEGRQVDDKIVNSKVQDALEDSPIYKFNEVRVMTYGGVVQLSGFVNTQDQKAKAAELARKVEGVHEVINNISLKPTATGAASGQQQTIQGQSSNRTLDADVKVDTKNSTEGAPVREDK